MGLPWYDFNQWIRTSHTTVFIYFISHLCVIAHTFEYEISEIICENTTYLSVNQNQL